MIKFNKSNKISKPTKGGRVCCSRCGGTGVFAHFGTCFRCGGNGSDPTDREWVFPDTMSDADIEAWDAKRVKSNLAASARNEKKRLEKLKAKFAAGAAFIAEHDGLDEALETDHHIVADIRRKIESFGDTSPKAIALVFKLAKEAKERAANLKKAAAESSHVGVVGERFNFSGKVEKIIAFDKTPMFYGDSTVGYITVVDCDGAKVKIFNHLKVRGKDIWAEEGDVVTFSARVKSHGDWEGVKETMISHPTKLKIISSEEVAA